MDMLCKPGLLRGTLPAIPSKSDAHRLLICAALADRPTLVAMPGWQGEDIEATIRCLTALGAAFEEQDGDRVLVTPTSALPHQPVLDCGESGATFRFMLPVVAALGCGGTFLGAGRLPHRPIAPLLAALRSGGVTVEGEAIPLRLSGRLAAGEYRLPGNVSSQFVSGLLFALPLVEGGGSIRLEQRLESAGYVEMTRSALARFGVEAAATEDGFAVPAGSGYRSPGEVSVEGDWSNMGFFLTAGALGGPVSCTGLRLPSLQGDSAVAQLLQGFGAQVTTEGAAITAQAGQSPKALEVDVQEIPDAVPILAVLAATHPGTTRFRGAGRLRLKESDRLASVAAMLRALGGTVEELPQELLVTGGAPLRGGQVACAGDHRIAMAGAIAATVATGDTLLLGAEAVGKSYPGFFEDFKHLGGNCHVVDFR